MSRHRDTGPESERVPCPVADCRGDMSPEHIECGCCWSRLPWRTQNALFEKSGDRLTAISRVKTAIRQGYKPEEIVL